VVSSAPARQRPFRPARPHAPLPAEIERHRAFVARIEGAIWAA
jgi:DNA polymerase-3 subunit epsilon